MKILISGDWQLQHANFPQVDKTVDHLLRICEKEEVGAFVHTGDMKHAINPLDGRVVNKGIEIVQRFRNSGVPFLLNLGNHDKLSMAEDGPHWLPALAAAGAITFDTPEARMMADGTRLFFLPYMSAENTIEAASNLVKTEKPSPKNSILFFHCGITKTRLNVLRKYEGEDAVPFDALHPEKYMSVIGGHFHLLQKIGANGWYAGSPFSTDWGEANQEKGFLLLNTQTGKVKPILSTIPGFFDPSWPDYVAPKTWAGASLRIHVPIPKGVVNVGAALLAAQKKAEADHPGARVVAVPELIEVKPGKVKVKAGTGDEDVIRQWVEGSIPQILAGQEDAVVSYLAHHLAGVADLVRSTAGVTVEQLEAKNYLSYEELKINFEKPAGIRLISAINYDWDKQGNGGGKSAYIHALLALLFGRTLKDQTADKLMRRHIPKGAECWLRGSLRLADGRVLEIFRGRRPKKVLLTLDGKDISTGSGDREVQKQISIYTGLTWETATSGLFLDQRDLNRLLVGNDGERKEIFSQFLNLERFAKALVILKKERDKSAEAVEENDRAVEAADTEIAQMEEFIETLKGQKAKDAAAAKATLDKAKARHATLNAHAEELGAKYRKAAKRLQEAEDAVRDAKGKVQVLRGDVERIEADIAQREKLIAAGNCPTCGQPLKGSAISTDTAFLRTKLKDAQKALRSAVQARDDLQNAASKLQKPTEAAMDASDEASEKASEAQGMVAAARKALKDASEESEGISTYQDRLKTAQANAKRLRKVGKGLAHDAAFTAYAVKAFAKDGVPAYIAGAICPRLNRAAAYYSRLFSDGVIEVAFGMDGEDLNVTVSNETGGETLGEQSNGETRIASLIVSFALRDILAPINLLFADEPGEGLSEANTRRFAAGLRELTDRFASIFVTTHNPVLLSELSDVPLVHIEKRKGISSVIMKRKNA